MADRGFPRITALLAGAFFLASGLWAMASPTSFFDTAATFQPYNQHLIQDIGSFMIGLGAVLLVGALAAYDGLGVALVGTSVGAIAHVVSHVIGRDLGGQPSRDIPFNIAIAAVLAVAAAAHVRRRA